MAIRIEDDFKHLIPPLTKEEFNQLEQNILDYGIRDPLVVAVYPESKGEVLIDGHNRYQISIKHGNLAYSVRRLDFDSKESAMCWVIDNQLGRRNIDSVTKFKLGSKKAELLKDKAKENQKQYYGNQYERTSINVDKSAEPVNIQKEIAKASGLSTGTVAKLQKIEKESPDKLDKIRAGEISINQAYQTVKRNNKIDEVKKRIEEYSSVQTGIVDIYKEHKKYNIIYADPPWKYWESGQKNQEIHYTTMTIDDICKLPVSDLADDNCILFMWTTYPVLQDAFKVIESWGFKYSTCGFCWVKTNKNNDDPFIGLGSWTRSNTEICLIGIKGNIERLSASVSQVVISHIEEHSKKPDIIRNKITELVGELPRIELFCRNPAEGWDVWGNEA